MSTLLEESSFAGRGNGLVSTRKIARGSCIKKEFAAVAVIDADHRATHCSYCCRPATQLKRCAACHQLHYCSRKCQRTDWTAHKSECNSFKKIQPKVAPVFTRLLLRTFRNITADVWKELCSNTPPKDTESGSGIAAIMATVRAMLTQDELDGNAAQQCYQLALKLVPNVFSLCDEEANPIGAALYPELAQLNHSCDPNACVVFEGKQAILRSLKDIDKGEEVRISYLPVGQVWTERQQTLLHQYQFVCDCHRCQVDQEEGDVLTAVVCPNCSFNTPQASRCPRCQGNLPDHCARLSQLLAQCKTNPELSIAQDMAGYRHKVTSGNAMYHDCVTETLDMVVQASQWDLALTLSQDDVLFWDDHNWQDPVASVAAYRRAKIAAFLGERMAPEYARAAAERLSITHGESHSLYNRLRVELPLPGV
eukprot:TRINITY_DN10253_c0_g2_i4.p1 TRINITY_DN10253_c0_g2~~TRINITY_DN10253_c0_g2_i4.p1  ORF type:complete len:423 (+),score=48.64 TRINITY_DN10253_c0_g2_i4:15-1283(+)